MKRTKIKKVAIKERWHYTAPYILNPQHPITVNVIGAGGSGSRILTELARMDHALKHLGHPGLFVTCYDGDIVTEANLGRQAFSQEDLGMNKAVILITRINQFMGTSWRAVSENYEIGSLKKEDIANITISCVDSIEARKNIAGSLSQNNFRKVYRNDPYANPYYWMDLGNTQNTGQFIIGTVGYSGYGQDQYEQPKESDTLEPVASLPTLFQKYPEFEHQKVKDMGPSCSVMEALNKQDLFINSSIVNFACATLWKMFREGKINYHGAFVNLKSLDIAKINL